MAASRLDPPNFNRRNEMELKHSQRVMRKNEAKEALVSCISNLVFE